MGRINRLEGIVLYLHTRKHTLISPNMRRRLNDNSLLNLAGNRAHNQNYSCKIHQFDRRMWLRSPPSNRGMQACKTVCVLYAELTRAESRWCARLADRSFQFSVLSIYHLWQKQQQQKKPTGCQSFWIRVARDTGLCMCANAEWLTGLCPPSLRQ